MIKRHLGRLKSIYRSVTVRSLLLIIFSTVILLVIDVYSLIEMFSLNRQSMENYRTSVDYYINQCDNSLSEITYSMKQITTNRLIDNSFCEMCYLEGLPFEIAKRAVQSRLSGYAQLGQYLCGYFVYVPERSIYLSSLGIKSNDYKGLIEGIVEDSTAQRAWKAMKYEDQYLFVRCLREEIGYAIAVVPMDAVFRDLVRGEDGIIFRIEVNREEENLDYTLERDDSISQKRLGKILYSMKNTDAQIIVYVDKMTQYMKSAYIIIWLTLMVGVMFLIYNLYFHIQHLLKPIKKLQRGMEEFSSGNLRMQLPMNNLSTEMELLFASFNDMTNQIRNLKIEVYESAMEREKIYNDYIAVQVQPHFFANILNLIYGMSQYENYQGIKKMTFHAGAYFRYLLGSKGSFVMLQNEIEGMKHFLEIQKMRYEEYLEYSLDIPKELMGQLIIPMLIHTFVSNSIKHNITYVSVLFVKVRIWREGKTLFIEVTDNGIGISDDIAARIENNQLETGEGAHIGIRNVKARLKLFYNDLAELKIQSGKNGTLIHIEVPVLVEDTE